MDFHICLFASVVLISLHQHAHAAPFDMFFNPVFPAIHHSSAQANANAFENVFSPDHSVSSASSANAQSFNTNDFGASASHSQNQGFSINRFGEINGNANVAHSQSYTFGDKKINVAFSNGFTIGADGQPLISNGHSITFE